MLTGAGIAVKIVSRQLEGGDISARKYRCVISSHVYDPAQGDPDIGIEPGRPFESLPDDWVCPDCGASKSDFEQMDE